MKPLNPIALLLLGFTLTGLSQQSPVPGPAVQGVKGVDQKAVRSVKPVEPVTTPPPPPAAGVTQETKKDEAVKPISEAPPPDAVQGVPPPPTSRSASSIRAVRGVTGIPAPKLKNLEAALLIKEKMAASGAKSRAAAAALLKARGKEPGTEQVEDGRDVFQEFAEQNAPGS